MGVSIGDLITLAKAGYTPAQVKELITLSEKVDQPKPEEPQGAAPATDEPKSASPEPVIGAPEKEAQTAAPEKEEINYKELYEKSQEDLKKAQAVNRGADASANNPKDPEKDLLDIFSTYH